MDGDGERRRFSMRKLRAAWSSSSPGLSVVVTKQEKSKVRRSEEVSAAGATQTASYNLQDGVAFLMQHFATASDPDLLHGVEPERAFVPRKRHRIGGIHGHEEEEGDVVDKNSLDWWLKRMPEEVVCHIFSFFTTGQLMTAGRVCRSWLGLTCRPSLYNKVDFTRVTPPFFGPHRDSLMSPGNCGAHSEHVYTFEIVTMLMGFIGARLSTVKEVRLGGERIGKFINDDVVKCLVETCGESLRVLDLRGSHITTKSLLFIARYSTRLRYLDLRGTNVFLDNSENGEYLTVLGSGCPELEELFLPIITEDIFFHLTVLTSVTRLNLETVYRPQWREYDALEYLASKQAIIKHLANNLKALRIEVASHSLPTLLELFEHTYPVPSLSSLHLKFNFIATHEELLRATSRVGSSLHELIIDTSNRLQDQTPALALHDPIAHIANSTPNLRRFTFRCASASFNAKQVIGSWRWLEHLEVSRMGTDLLDALIEYAPPLRVFKAKAPQAIFSTVALQIPIANFFSTFTDLRKLHVTDWTFENEAMSQLARSTNLTSLTLHRCALLTPYCPLKARTAKEPICEALKPLSVNEEGNGGMAQLRKLQLVGCTFHGGLIFHFPSLEKLVINPSRMKDKFMSRILVQHRKIKHLELKESFVTHKSLSLLVHLPQLRTLFLPIGLRLDDRALDVLGQCKELRGLDLSHCGTITTNGVRRLAHDCPYLVSVTLVGCRRLEWDRLNPDSHVHRHWFPRAIVKYVPVS